MIIHTGSSSHTVGYYKYDLDIAKKVFTKAISEIGWGLPILEKPYDNDAEEEEDFIKEEEMEI